MNQDIWIFDIDGVITDPKTKEISNPEIIQIIKKHLILGKKIAFNTGRSAKWLEHKIINPLKELIFSDEINYFPLTNLVSVCEMGNVIIKYGIEGESRKKVLSQNVIPKTLQQTIKDMVSDVYSNSMFVDKTKEVILTIEMKDDCSFEEYEERQEEFQKEINIIIKNYHPSLHVKPSSTTIAIDVKPIDSGKNLGAKQILEWYLEKEEINKKIKFICFGDSTSDFDMSNYFFSKGVNTEFVFVGTDKEIKRKYPIHITKNKFTLGTLEYLEKIKN